MIYKQPFPPTSFIPETVALIDSDALIHNYKTLLGHVQNYAPHTTAMAVVKANGYGHGTLPVTHALVAAGCRSFAVSRLSEALALREQLRIEADERFPLTEATDPAAHNEVANAPILILGYSHPADVAIMAEAGITAALLSPRHAADLAAEARRAGRSLLVHAALDTGMNRIGYPAHSPAEIASTAEALAALDTQPCPGGGLVLDGMFTHFAKADEDYDAEITTPDSLTATQLDRYTQVLSRLEAKGRRPRVCHACNSAAAVRFPGVKTEGCFDTVRLGINLYGYGVPFHGDNAPRLRPVMRLVTAVSHVHALLPGETVGYGGTYAAPTPRTLATLPLGYADGWLRALSGCMVTLHTPAGDYQAPIVGRVCMDQCMLDITHIPVGAVTPGTPVTLFGETPEQLEALARRANTITYELLCLVTARVPRIQVSADQESV